MPDLSYADCRCRVTWELPPNSNWQDAATAQTDHLKIVSVISVGNGDMGVEKRTKSIEHLAEAKETTFRWKGIGMRDGQNWGVRAGINPSKCKIDGITYQASWNAKRVIETEEDREVEIALGLPDLVAMA